MLGKECAGKDLNDAKRQHHIKSQRGRKVVRHQRDTNVPGVICDVHEQFQVAWSWRHRENEGHSETRGRPSVSVR